MTSHSSLMPSCSQRGEVRLPFVFTVCFSTFFAVQRGMPILAATRQWSEPILVRASA